MALTDEMAAFQQCIHQIHAALDDIEVAADRLPALPIDSLSCHFTILEENLEEALHQVQQSRDGLHDIGTRWGNGRFTPAGTGKQGVNVVGKAIATAQIATSMVTGIATQTAKAIVPPLQDVAIPTLELRDRLTSPNVEEIEKNHQEGNPSDDQSLKDLQSHYEILEDGKRKKQGSSKKKKKKS